MSREDLPGGSSEIKTRFSDGRYIVRVSGDLTDASLPELFSVVRSLVEFESTTVVIDLTEVRSVDSSTLTELGEISELAAEYGSEAEIKPPPGR